MKKVLVINPFGIGDAIFSMYLVEALRRADPKLSIGFVCNERTQALVRLNPSIDKTFVFNRDLLRRLWKKHPFLAWKKLSALLGMVREERFDTLLDLSLGREYSFFSALAGIPRRIGFDFKGRGLFLTQKKKLEGYEGAHAVDIQLRLLHEIGVQYTAEALRIPIRVPDAAQTAAESLLKKSGWQPGMTILALAPGGGRSWGPNASYKQWDPERFAQAANLFAAGSPCFVALLGDRFEEALLKRTAGLLAGRSAIFAGEALEKVSAILLRAKLLLCNDGGLMHLANTLGVRTVSIFGPVDERVYGPYRRDVFARVLTQDVPCRPCYQRFHFPPCAHERRCLEELPVEKALQAMKEAA